MNQLLTDQLVMKISQYITNLSNSSSNVPTNELENISRLISLFVVPNKDVDLHKILRDSSDNFVEFIVLNRDKLSTDLMMKTILQLFIVEWCFRNDYLDDDWDWEWEEDGKAGRANVNPKIPFRDIPLP